MTSDKMTSDKTTSNSFPSKESSTDQFLLRFASESISFALNHWHLEHVKSRCLKISGTASLDIKHVLQKTLRNCLDQNSLFHAGKIPNFILLISNRDYFKNGYSYSRDIHSLFLVNPLFLLYIGFFLQASL